MSRGVSQLGCEGQRFDRLLLVELVRKTPQHAYYRCICDRGKEIVTTLNNLRKANTRSCGCLPRVEQYYDPVSGVFYTNGRPVSKAGKNGYLSVTWKGKRYYAHRLAWLLTHGCPVPAGMDIDHINRIRTDNRPENLRVVTRSENLKNREPPTNSMTGKHEEVVRLFDLGFSCTKIAEQLNTDRHYVADYLTSVGKRVKTNKKKEDLK
jgi:DNA-binding CsgD family transcriptional regulator